jgi:hypothetical protein
MVIAMDLGYLVSSIADPISMNWGATVMLAT